MRNKKTASYFTITLSLFSLSFFGLFAIRPTLMTAISLVKSVNDLQKLNADYENKISSIVRAQSEYEKIRDSYSLMMTALPANASFSKLSLAIEKFAQKENVEISQLQIDSAPISNLPPSSKILSFNFHFIGSGDYPSISLFLSHLLNWKRIVAINSMELSQSGSTFSSSLRITFKGTAFYEP